MDSVKNRDEVKEISSIAQIPVDWFAWFQKNLDMPTGEEEYPVWFTQEPNAFFILKAKEWSHWLQMAKGMPLDDEAYQKWAQRDENTELIERGIRKLDELLKEQRGK